MSVLPPEIQHALSQLLSVLQSADNVQRTQAEEQLQNDWVQPRPDVLLMGLVEQIQGATDSSTRSYAAVLFRRIATRTREDPQTNRSRELFLTLRQPSRNAIQQKLLVCLQAESAANVRNKIGDAVAEVARQYTEEGMRVETLLHMRAEV